jgi:hypothetical protein
VQDVACDIGDPPLRTPDALQVASALLLGEALTAFIAYDHRLADAASPPAWSSGHPASRDRPKCVRE